MTAKGNELGGTDQKLPWTASRKLRESSGRELRGFEGAQRQMDDESTTSQEGDRCGGDAAMGCNGRTRDGLDRRVVVEEEEEGRFLV